MKETIIISEKEFKKAKMKDKIREKYDSAKMWCKEHPQEIRNACVVIVPAVAGAVKVIGKCVNLGKQKALKENFCYDRSLGHYWALKRAPSNKEWLEIDRRKKNGERLADILNELKLLK